MLVSLTGYNARGEAFETIDPAGTVNRKLADDAGRQVCMIGNFVAEALGAAGEGLGCAPGCREQAKCGLWPGLPTVP